jgi:hypothetical protein
MRSGARELRDSLGLRPMTQWQAELLSLAIEAPAALLVTALGFRLPGARALVMVTLAAVAGTALTHPVVWNGVLALAPRIGWMAAVAALEVFAVAGETVVYRLATALSWRRAALVSLVANAASFGVGLVLAA